MIGYYPPPRGIVGGVDVSHALAARQLAADLSRLSAVASALADQTVYELTRGTRAQDVAQALGLSEAAVRKAVQQHNRRVVGLTPKRPKPKVSRTD
jgi:hypothetical protein